METTTTTNGAEAMTHAEKIAAHLNTKPADYRATAFGSEVHIMTDTGGKRGFVFSGKIKIDGGIAEADTAAKFAFKYDREFLAAALAIQA